MMSEFLLRIIDSVADEIEANTDLLTDLDRAIGDSDHGINMKRGLNSVLQQADKLADISIPKALQKIGTSLVMSIGGASGPLYGSLFIAMGKTAAETPMDLAHIARMAAEGVSAVKKRGKSDLGEKTMLDVLGPVADALKKAAAKGATIPETLASVMSVADQGLESTRNMIAKKGRASFLGRRSIGHLDPGAQSSQLIVQAVCRSFEELLLVLEDKRSVPGYVGIVIVSHSPDVAKGTADMARQMVGDEVPIAWCGGNPDRGLGTDVASIKKCIEGVWSQAGVALLVDLGGAETNSEMAIEMLPEEYQSQVVICNAPIVEGTVMAATVSASGGSLDEVRTTAEELSP